MPKKGDMDDGGMDEIKDFEDLHSDRSADRMNKFLSILSPVLLALLIFTAYRPVLHGGILWDDDVHIFANPDMTGLDGLKRIWTSERAVYYPLTSTAFWLLFQRGGANTFPFHLLNILVHTANAFLFWSLLKYFRIKTASLAAFLFALHPVCVESVAWMTELKNLLACLFFLLSARYFLYFDEALEKPKDGGKLAIPYLASLFFFGLSLLAKPVAVMFPLLILLYDGWKGRPFVLTMVRRVLPFFLISAAVGVWTIWEQTFHSGAEGAAWSLSFLERSLIAGRAFWFYLGKLLWPQHLSFIYTRWTISLTSWPSYSGLVCLLALMSFAFAKKPWRNLAFAAAVYLILLFPVLGFFNIYFFRYSFVADHFQYVASLAPMSFFAFYLGRIRWIGWPVFFAFWVLTWGESHRFLDSEILWTQTIRTDPGSWLAQNNLANILAKKGDPLSAVKHYEEAIKTKPDFAEAHTNLAVVLTDLKRYDLALRHLDLVLKLQPNSAEIHNNLGRVFAELGKGKEAIREFEKAVEIKPDFTIARRNLESVQLEQYRPKGR